MEIQIKILPSFSSEFTAELSDEDEKYTLSYEGGIHAEENIFTDKMQNNKIFLTQPEWNSLVKELKGCITIIPENIIGLDGTRYEITIENGFNKHHFSIWELMKEKHPLRNFIMSIDAIIKDKTHE